MLLGTIISEPFFNFNELIAISRASVPLATVIQLLTFTNLAKFFSNIFTSSPPINLEFLINDTIFEITFFFVELNEISS